MIEKLFFTTKETIRIDVFLRNELPLKLKKSQEEISNSKIRRLIAAGFVYVNGKKIVRPAFELRGNSTVCVEFDGERFFFEKQPDDIKFTLTDKDILYEDENLIFINKPYNFPVEQTITGNRDNLHDKLVEYLWQRNPELRNPPYAGIMHRLDKDTSGVILFTKNRSINKEVQQMFESHSFIKEYSAVVVPSDPSKKLSSGEKFTVEKFMGRISGKSQAGKWGSVPESKGGQYSKTDFEVIKETSVAGKKAWLLKCSLYTGRTHQIRVHLSEAGFPIAGDKLYGGIEAERMYLHAQRLCNKSELLKFDVSSILFE
ncbi:MAG: RluA family pseudouridine synthase [Treponema sp.]|nr:RluA family pseudouridine synthase [Treponema sp.]